MSSGSDSAVKVLFADDSSTIRLMLERFFDEAGCESRGCENGREALETFKDFDPDVVVLDLQMPVLDGYAACEAIKEDSDVPVIILTSMDEDSDKRWAEQQGADRYLTKPVDRDELIGEINEVISGKNLSEANG